MSDPTNYEEALARIRVLEEQLDSLDGLVLLRERASSDSGARHAVKDVARDLDGEDLLGH